MILPLKLIGMLNLSITYMDLPSKVKTIHVSKALATLSRQPVKCSMYSKMNVMRLLHQAEVINDVKVLCRIIT